MPGRRPGASRTDDGFAPERAAPYGRTPMTRPSGPRDEAGTQPAPEVHRLAEDIVRSALDYVRERQHWSPRMNEALRARAMGLRAPAGLVLGLLQVPRPVDAETVNVFQSARHADFMKTFDRRSVLVTGWVDEWRLARREGYRFVWSFGVTAAVDLAMFRGWMSPLRMMLARWRRALGRARRVTVYLSDDTSPFGTFMAHLARALPNEARSVCVAHGYFCRLDVPLRYEGALCDHNFVWDERQVELLSATHAGLQVIGPPLDARARPAAIDTLVLVGVGHPSAEEAVFERSMRCYAEIAEIAARRHGLRVLYRPHPSERADPALMDSLRARFGGTDDLSSIERLNSPRSVFVGFASSLLFEAAIAGHAAVYVAGRPGVHPVFPRDLELVPEDVSPIDDWLARRRAEPVPAAVADGADAPDVVERFRRAVARIG